MLLLCMLTITVLGMAAGPATSTAATFTATAGATIVGEDVGVVKFTVTGQEVFCESASYKGTAPSASFTTLTVTPTYTNCKAKIFGSTINATVTGFGAGGCDYVLHSTGTADLVCAEGKDVTVTAGTCVVHIPGQAGLGTISYDTGSAGGAKNLTLTLNVTGIKETHTDGFLCPLLGTGTTEGGALEGVIRAAAQVTVAHPDGAFTTIEGADIFGWELDSTPMTFTDVEILCEAVTYTATAPASSFDSVTVTPAYGHCSYRIAGQIFNVTVSGFGAGGCDYVLHAAGTLDLVCPEGKEVTVSSVACVVHVPPQSGLGPIYIDTGSLEGTGDLLFTMGSTFKETHTDGFFCPLASSGTTESGIMVEEVTLLANIGGTPVPLTDDAPGSTVEQVDLTDH